MKRYRRGQDRRGNPDRRQLEFDAIMDQVKRRKQAFIDRLARRLVPHGECLLYQGTKDHKGYPRLNIRFRSMNVTIHAHRLFLIMKLQRPIRLGFDAGHSPSCTSLQCVKHVSEHAFRHNCNAYKEKNGT